MALTPETPDADAAVRGRILHGAARALQDRGFRGLRIQDVAREAKVSLRTFYEHFENKEDCLGELLMQMTDGLLDAIEQVEERELWADTVDQRAHTYLSIMASTPELTQAILVEGPALGPRMLQARRRAMDRFSRRLREIVERSRANHPEVKTREFTEVMAMVVTGGLTELVLQAIEEGRAAELVEIAPIAGDVIWALITAEERPRTGGA